MKKASISSNGRTILPKTITPQQQHPGPDRKTLPPNVSFSSQHCQNEGKQHSSYSNVLNSKLISEKHQPSLPPPPPSSSPSPTNMPYQQKQTNGSYGRLTNKLNCCKSCVRDAEDALVHKCANDILSKSKMTTKYHSVDSNSNCCNERDQIKCKLPESHSKKTTLISGAVRRNSIDVNGLFRNPSLMHSFGNNDLHGRRAIQSLDDCDIRANTHQPFLKKLSPAQSESLNDFHRNGNVTYLTQSVAKQNTANGDGRRVIKQTSLDNYPDAPTRLRSLDMKMRKHKVDVMKHTNDHEKPSIYTDHKRLLSYPPTNQFRNKLDPFTRSTYSNGDCVYPKIGIDSLLHTKNSTFRKNSTNGGGSYGIITSSELYKLRGTPERIT